MLQTQMVFVKLRTILFKIINEIASSSSKLLQGRVLNIKTNKQTNPKPSILARIDIEEIPVFRKKIFSL